jgi:DNA-binding transcriptional ArsR family regulator
MKYWNKALVRRKRERERRREEGLDQIGEEEIRRHRTYTKGDLRKDARLMLDVLGSERNRRMLSILRAQGAMSLTKLCEPFGLTLPAAHERVNALERAGLITTQKQGRVRFCIYNPAAPKELGHWLKMRNPFDLGE